MTGNAMTDLIASATAAAILGGTLMRIFGKKKNGEEKSTLIDHSNRLSVVETKVEATEAAVIRIEAKQETNRTEAREGVQGIHERLDKVLDGRGRR